MLIDMKRPFTPQSREDRAAKKPQVRHIWEKMFRTWIWIEENDLDKADWFVKLDDDAYFFPINTKRLIRDRKWCAAPLGTGPVCHGGHCTCTLVRRYPTAVASPQLCFVSDEYCTRVLHPSTAP